MEAARAKPLIFSSLIFILFLILAQSANPCEPTSCNGPGAPAVRFPFRLKDRQPAQCGYPGFELTCNSKNQTILRLPRSGDFMVTFIDYKSQALLINDPNSCLPNRILNFSLSGSSFSVGFMMTYTFLNCSSDWVNSRWTNRFVPVNCLRGRNYTVLAMQTRLADPRMPPSCSIIAVVSVPVQSPARFYWWWSTDLMDDLELGWSVPECGDCENRGGFCRYKSGMGREIGCSISSKSGLSRGAKYGIIIGVGIPGLLCMIGLVSYIFGVLKIRRRLNSNLPTSTISEPRMMIRTVGGLDLPTISSYPKTVLGESGRLPKPADGICPICLCEYQPKETLRSIPECNHYFHADCIDEWLKLNGTCPLCRNSPQISNTTPNSSPSLSSSSSMPSN